jgi:hypothetical protein
MNRRTEQPPPETVPEPTLADHPLDDSVRRREVRTRPSAAAGPDGQPPTPAAPNSAAASNAPKPATPSPAPASTPVGRIAAYLGSPAAPAPRAADPVPSPVAAEPPARPRVRLSAWLEPLEPLLFVLVVAALAGAFLGLPDGGSEQAAGTVRSPEQQAVQRLDEVRFRLRDQLAFAGTADEQANAAQRLAMAYGRAADHMSSPALVSAAHDASIAYLAVESAARAGDQDAYDNARSRVESAEERIESELARTTQSRAPE